MWEVFIYNVQRNVHFSLDRVYTYSHCVRNLGKREREVGIFLFSPSGHVHSFLLKKNTRNLTQSHNHHQSLAACK